MVLQLALLKFQLSKSALRLICCTSSERVSNMTAAVLSVVSTDCVKTVLEHDTKSWKWNG